MRLTRKELKFTVGLTTNFDACMLNVVGTYLCPHLHCTYMWACKRVLPVPLFISPLLLLVCLCVLWLYIIVLSVLSSLRPFVWYSVRPSVCLSVCMFTCTYVEANVLVYVLWTKKIEFTWLIPCLVLVFTGHLFHFFSCRGSNDGIDGMCTFFCKNCVYDCQKVHIYLWAITLYYSTSRLWQWRKVNNFL